MQPLTDVRASERGQGNDTPAAADRVLPRILRRPARLFSRLNVRLPRRFGLLAAAALFAATAVVGAVLGGHVTTVVAAVTSWGGLGIHSIEITGQSEASEVDILDSLDIGPFPSLLTFDLDTAREQVEALPWIETARLSKLFPNTLQVTVVEKEPAAVWQHGGEVRLVDADGKVIAPLLGDRHGDLPYLVGADAAARLEDYLNLLAAAPAIAPRVKAGVLVSGRRWTLVLRDGIELLLPHERPDRALAEIARLDDETSLLAREIAAVDFRFGDRTILRLTERGIEERDELLKKRARARGGA